MLLESQEDFFHFSLWYIGRDFAICKNEGGWSPLVASGDPGPNGDPSGVGGEHYYSLLNTMKRLIEKYIIWCAKRKMRKNTAKVIAITGTVGKSSTKEAIFTVLKSQYSVRANYGSLNNELGLPLAIFGQRNGTNVFSWLWVVLKITFKTFLFDKKIDIYILECGIDTPGDMDVILDLIAPDIVVITSVFEEVHMEYFKDFATLVTEKWKLAHEAKEGALVIANYDNVPTLEQRSKLVKKRAITFGLNQKADYFGHTISFNEAGTDFMVRHRNNEQKFHLALLGKVQVYTVLPAIIIGREFNIPWAEIQESLLTIMPLPGRLSLLPAINGAMLLEGSYNATPSSMKAALEVFKNLPAKRKIAIVGDMRELGPVAERSHNEILTLLAKESEIVCMLGPNYEKAFQDLPSHVRHQAALHHFETREDIVKFIVPKIAPGDLILIKGSQNTILLEKVSAKLLADPSTASTTLPRQYGKWLSQDA